jgi:hypothetical protein
MPPIIPKMEVTVTAVASIMSATPPLNILISTDVAKPSHSPFSPFPPLPSHSFIPPLLTMALLNSLRILTVVSLVVLNASFDALPVNALAVERAHVGRALGHAHAEIAKKRDSSKKCRPRPSSTSHAVGAIASPTHTTTTTSPLPSSNPSQSAHTTSSSGGSKIIVPWSNNEEFCLKNFAGNWKEYAHSCTLSNPSLTALAQTLQLESGPIYTRSPWRI